MSAHLFYEYSLFIVSMTTRSLRSRRHRQTQQQQDVPANRVLCSLSVTGTNCVPLCMQARTHAAPPVLSSSSMGCRCFRKEGF